MAVAEPQFLLMNAVLPWHRAWIRHAKLSALIAFFWYLVVVIAAWRLGIISMFKVPGVGDVSGFWSKHWGPLFLILMPLSSFLGGALSMALLNGTRGIDKLIVPKEQKTGNFSKFLSQKLRRSFPYIHLCAIFAPLALTIVADGSDIVSPLLGQASRSSPDKDWASVGYMTARAAPDWYFVFNLAAWGMQLFASYVGWLIFVLYGYGLAVIFKYGLGGRLLTDFLQRPEAQAERSLFKPMWRRNSVRCGLEQLDNVFLSYVLVNILLLGACAISIYSNVYKGGGATVGSWILAAVGTLVPLASAMWIFFPYFSTFPKYRLPGARVDPNPWPFGSQVLSWTLLVLVCSLWLILTGWVLFGKKAP